MSNEDVFNRLKGKMNTAKKVATRKALEELKVLIPELIRTRTRLGAGVEGDLEELSEKYIKFREKYASNLHPDTSPGESNLTATGQLLDSIIAKVIKNKVVRSFKKGKRKADINGKRSKKITTNEELNNVIEERNGGKPLFFELNDQERLELRDVAFEIIKEEIKKIVKG